MNKQQLEKVFESKFINLFELYYVQGEDGKKLRDKKEEIKDFIFQTVIPEVLKSVLPETCKNKFIKKKAKELYDVTL